MASRTENTKRNIIASYILMAVQMVFQFVSRFFIVKTLGEEYLGLSSLFTSVLSVLGIAELGFTTSIVFFMYKPLAEGDTNHVCALLRYLQVIYKRVGLAILCIGLIITPIIPIIIKGDVPADINIYILYALYLVNTSVSYFLYAHKTALLTAMQRLDLTKIATCVVIFIQYILQLIALLVFHNYYVFVIAMIIGTAAVNIVTAAICNRKYPEYTCTGEIGVEEKKEIATKVKGMLVCNISGVTYTSLDSIIISMLQGLTLVAVYNNYITIFNAVSTIVNVIRSAMQASVGNSVASETLEKNYKDVRLWQFLFSIIGIWGMTCMICLFQPFMKIWMGEEMLLPMIDVVFLGTWFLVVTVQHAFYLYLMGSGLFNEMKWIYVSSTVFNLIMNIVLGRLIGVTGIILASLLSCLIFGTFMQCRVIFKHYFEISAKGYILEQFKYFLVAAMVAAITFLACSLFNVEGIMGLFVRLLLCVVIPGILLYAIFCRNENYARSLELLRKVIKR